MIVQPAYLIREQARAEAAAWARDLMADGRFLILDTETTGTGPADEVIEIGVLSPDLVTQVSVRVRPMHVDISEGAQAVHGISMVDVEECPTYFFLADFLGALFRHNRVVIYNAAYDERLLLQSARVHGFLSPFTTPPECAMLAYAKFMGDWNDYRNDWKWHKLPAVDGHTAHGALADCFATLALIKKMAQEGISTAPSPEMWAMGKALAVRQGLLTLEEATSDTTLPGTPLKDDASADSRTPADAPSARDAAPGPRPAHDQSSQY